VRVLVAEDDEALRSVLARGLTENGYIVDAVPDGEAAMTYLATYEYEVMVLDWRMPRMSGYDVLAAMKSRKIAVPVLMLTALDRSADRIAGLVLAPHYSALSIKAYRDQLEQALAGRAELSFVDSWHDEPGFIALLADRVRGTQSHVVFTAHSLPERILAMGDPYQAQLLETARLVAEASGLGEQWSFSFQSESPTGEPWLGPDILDHLAALRRDGVEDVLICPVGFVSDHLEIRWDLDVEAQERAAELGLRVDRIEMPNADPAFVRTLAGIARRALGVPSRA